MSTILEICHHHPNLPIGFSKVSFFIVIFSFTYRSRKIENENIGKLYLIVHDIGQGKAICLALSFLYLLKFQL